MTNVRYIGTSYNIGIRNISFVDSVVINSYNGDEYKNYHAYNSSKYIPKEDIIDLLELS